jgi:hypothetical protein
MEASCEGCRDAAACHDLQTAVKRTRSCGEAALDRIMMRRSSGRSDHRANEDVLLPSPMLICVVDITSWTMTLRQPVWHVEVYK